MKKNRAHPRLIKRYADPGGRVITESGLIKKPPRETLDLRESSPPTPMRVLVIENDGGEESVRDHLGEGFSVQRAPSVHAACGALAADRFDLILFDIRMHDAAAIESITRLKDAAEDSAIVFWNGEEARTLDDRGSTRVSGFLKAERAPAHLFRLAVERQREFRQLKATTAGLVDELLSANEKLIYQASQDPLTGLLNRCGLQEMLHEEMPRMRRTSSTLSAILVDCDDFKSISDTLGYWWGDTALGIVANTLRATIRPEDHVGRVGSNEFLVLLPGTRPAEGTLVGRRFLQELSTVALPPALRERKLTLGISVDRVPAETHTIEEVIAAIDAPLKVAKSRSKRGVTAGGGNVNDVSPNDTNAIASVLSDERRLRIVSQSIVRIEDGSVVAHELLVRGPRGDLESPKVLFALANSTNSLTTFDLNCLRASMAMRAHLPSPRRCHVNVAPSTLIATPIATILDIVGCEWRPHQLCIELSEQQIIGSPVRLRDARMALRAQGIDVALDHVGFGHSSLEALIILKPDIVKIDRRFVQGVYRDAGKARDLQRLADILQGLGAQVIAEGVESLSDIGALRRIGIEYGQGYFWDTPSEIVAPSPTNWGAKPDASLR